MDTCNEYMELISAYSDGELSGADKQKLEDHLRECAECSSILEIYRGITVAVDESCVPAPESLRVNVMERIAGETSAQAEANLKKFKTVNRILTRYLPAAACLAFLLLTIPRLFGIGGLYSRSDNASAPMSAPMPSAASGAMQAPAGGGNIFSEDAEVSMNDNSEAYAMDTGASESPSLSGGPAPATAALSPDAIEAPAPVPDAPEAEMLTPPATSSAPADAGDISSIGGEAGGDSGLIADNEIQVDDEQSEIERLPSELSTVQEDPNKEPDAELNVMPEEVPEEEPEEVPEEETNTYLQDVYAVIIINGSILKGNMPALFSQYMPEDFDIDEIGYMSFEVPREQADMLINYLSDLEGVVINMANENGDHAMVYYIP